MLKFRTTLLLLAFLGLAFSVHARHDPWLDWQEVKTEHFIIIFPGFFQTAASQAAELAEIVYPKVKTLLGYAPLGRTAIILNPMRDEANGVTQSIFRKMEFFMAPSLGKDFGPLDPSWLESLLVHEYTHLCHGMRVEGIAGLVHSVFGEITGVNFIAPQWWVEGIAVYAETALTTGGRGRNPYQAMRLASNLLSEAPWDIAQIGVAPLFNLPWDRVYLAGYPMLAQLSQTTQLPDWLARLSTEQSAFPFLGLGHVWQKVLGNEPEKIWNETKACQQAAMALRFGPARLAMKNSQVIAAATQTIYSHPRWLADNTVLAFQAGVDPMTGLIKIDPKTKLSTSLFKPGRMLGSFYADPSGQTIIFSRLETDCLYPDTKITDLVTWQVGQGITSLTRGQHCHSPDVTREGKILCIVNQGEYTNLGTLEQPSKSIWYIPGPQGAVYLNPVWSPDATQIAAVVRIQGVQDICLVNPETGELQALMGWNSAAEWDPAFSWDGRYLFFVSDRTGAHQIYAYQMSNKKIFQVTDARLGAFEPAVSYDNTQLVFSEYVKGNSQQLVVAPLDPASWTELAPITSQPQPVADAIPMLSPKRIRPYSGWAYLLPDFWLPMARVEANRLLFGVMSAQQDPLALQAWTGQVYADAESGQPYGQFTYTHQALWLPVSVNAYTLPYRREETRHYRNGSIRSYEFFTRRNGVDCTLEVPLRFWEANDELCYLELDLSYRASQFQSGSVAAFLDPLYTSLQLQAAFVSIQQTPLDFVPRRGLAIYAGGEKPWPGHQYNGLWNYAEIDGYIPGLFSHQACNLSVYGSRLQGTFPSQGYVGSQTPFLFDDLADFQAIGQIGYNFPVWYMDGGLGLWPLYFHGLWARLFVNQGMKWSGEAMTMATWQEQSERVFGLNLNLETEIFWYLPMQISGSYLYNGDTQEYKTQVGVKIGGLTYNRHSSHRKQELLSPCLALAQDQ